MQMAARPVTPVTPHRQVVAENPEKMDLADRFFSSIAEYLEGEKPKAKTTRTAMVRPARAAPRTAPRPAAVPLPANHLKGTVLTLGANKGLGAAPGKNTSSCVKKGTASLCVETLQWPAEAAGLFTVNSSLYNGAGKALVRYDGGRASRYHVLFPAEKFDDVLAYFQRRFGPPTGSGSKRLTAIGFKDKSNSIAQWLSADAQGQTVTALEIRSVDDVRGKLPDVRHGVVMLVPWRDAPTLPRRTLLKLMMAQAQRR